MNHKRMIMRLAIVVIAAVLSMQVIPGLSVAAAWPSASPLLSICAAVAERAVSLVSLVGLPLLVLALLRGRWFCHHMCPTGCLLIWVGRLSRRHSAMRRFPVLGPGLCLVMLGSALAGFPLLLNLDPLVQFNGFFSVWRGADWTWVDGLPALSLIILGLITAIWPHLWCERICPLGALQALLGMAGKTCWHVIGRKPAPQPVPGEAIRAETPDVASPDTLELETKCPRRAGEMDTGRRAFLILVLGAVLGWMLKRMGIHCPGPDGLIRPPGAVAESMLHGLCSRCGSCMRACPEGIIIPDRGIGGPGSLLTPRLDFSERYCNEWCQVCTGVCPTGAIRRLSLEAKRALSIGTARVDRNRCLAWHEAQYCMVCHEFCSYQAVRIVEHNGVNCPEVDEKLCRGCGACQGHCPAGTPRAIVVHARVQAPCYSKEIDNSHLPV
ncbi:MAG: 4Fe-4S binding protein [Kiritimatiellae bacterium]|nr:4Fe-4S binding protein [Kiritimatiellia bacterium]